MKCLRSSETRGAGTSCPIGPAPEDEACREEGRRIDCLQGGSIYWMGDLDVSDVRFTPSGGLRPYDYGTFCTRAQLPLP